MGHQLIGVGDWVRCIGKDQLGLKDTHHRLIDGTFSHLSDLYLIEQLLVVVHRQRHLDIQPGFNRFLAIANAKDEIRNGEALKTPVLAQDVGQQ